jgi:hypothetical protein
MNHTRTFLCTLALTVIATTAEANEEVSERPTPSSRVCPNQQSLLEDTGFPNEARRVGLTEGSAVVLFTLDAENHIRNPIVIRASHRAFANHALRLATELSCKGPGHDIKVMWPISYQQSRGDIP